MVKSERSQFDGIFLCRHRISRDLELEIKLQKRKIGAGNIAHQGQSDGALGVLGRQQLGARRFCGAPQPAEEVQLECSIGRQSQKVKLRLKGILFSPSEISVSLYLRKKVGSRDDNLRSRGIDAFRRDLHVVILLQRCANQLLQLRILEDLPPRKICEGRRLSLRLWVIVQIMEHGGSSHVWSMVVRTYLAPTDQTRNQE